jgi:altronate dehydratase large subunit
MREILGYRRRSGPPGIRNHVVCIHTVECSSFVSQRIAALGPDVQSLGFPGCYGNEYASRLMVALATHPNVGAVLLVSLGCEGTDPQGMADAIRVTGRPVEILRIQEAGGTGPSITLGQEIVAKMLKEVGDAPRIGMSVADLVVGTQCGGSDATSGISANPAVGCAFDLLVDAGATVLIGETLEMIGCADIVARRAANSNVADNLRKTIEKAEQFSRQSSQASIATGNFIGGLTTIEEKSVGALAKVGTRPISGVVKVAQRPPRNGLYVLDSVPDPSPFSFGLSNPNDSADALDLISCGAHMIIFTTGRGSVIGSAISPLLKICGNPQTYARMSGDMDLDAGRIIAGEATPSLIGDEVFGKILDVAGGDLTKAELLGHAEYCIGYKFQAPCTLV